MLPPGLFTVCSAAKGDRDTGLNVLLNGALIEFPIFCGMTTRSPSEIMLPTALVLLICGTFVGVTGLRLVTIFYEWSKGNLHGFREPLLDFEFCFAKSSSSS
jgi:hypothetical protein